MRPPTLSGPMDSHTAERRAADSSTGIACRACQPS
jgi:hypothetical protein